MRILDVPLMVAEVSVTALPLLVEHSEMREVGDPDYPAEPIGRGLMERGLLVGDIVRGETAQRCKSRIAQRVLQMPLVLDQRAVEWLASTGPYRALHDRIHPGHPHCCARSRSRRRRGPDRTAPGSSCPGRGSGI
jgi:hypothetical protein